MYLKGLPALLTGSAKVFSRKAQRQSESGYPEVRGLTHETYSTNRHLGSQIPEKSRK
jgi:CDP-glycerol glycerophosphotransferase (TagB/SpsB family)|tara:strand:- start:248 stop:418 length:171 start_codon:yes stop_codon:yes gene_type:complete